MMIAALDSLGTSVYILLVSLVMNHAADSFGRLNEAVAPLAFIMLFVFSALVTGGLILGRPLMLYIDGKKKEGLKLLFYTGASLLILLILVFLSLILIR